MSNAIVNGLAGAGGGIIAQIITYPLQTSNQYSPFLLLIVSLLIIYMTWSKLLLLFLPALLNLPIDHTPNYVQITKTN